MSERVSYLSIRALDWRSFGSLKLPLSQSTNVIANKVSPPASARANANAVEPAEPKLFARLSRQVRRRRRRLRWRNVRVAITLARSCSSLSLPRRRQQPVRVCARARASVSARRRGARVRASARSSVRACAPSAAGAAAPLVHTHRGVGGVVRALDLLSARANLNAPLVRLHERARASERFRFELQRLGQDCSGARSGFAPASQTADKPARSAQATACLSLLLRRHQSVVVVATALAAPRPLLPPTPTTPQRRRRNTTGADRRRPERANERTGGEQAKRPSDKLFPKELTALFSNPE